MRENRNCQPLAGRDFDSLRIQVKTEAFVPQNIHPNEKLRSQILHEVCLRRNKRYIALVMEVDVNISVANAFNEWHQAILVTGTRCIPSTGGSMSSPGQHTPVTKHGEKGQQGLQRGIELPI